MLLEITPSCLHYIEIIAPTYYCEPIYGEAVCTIYDSAEKRYYIKAPSPLVSSANLLIFLHECAHIVLRHMEGELVSVKPIVIRPTHPSYGTYLNEVLAWAKVYRWLDQYNVYIDKDEKKDIVKYALSVAWIKLKGGKE